MITNKKYKFEQLVKYLSTLDDKYYLKYLETLVDSKIIKKREYISILKQVLINKSK